MDARSKMLLLDIKSGQKTIYQIVDATKKESEEERKEVDNRNLTLQSLLYGKDYFLKQVHFCKEFKTPNLQEALKEEDYLNRVKNLQPNVSEI